MSHLGLLVSMMMAVVGMVHGDIYMHNPRGSNNRLDEENRNRDNGNRLFDSQNNERGGYNKGGPKQGENKNAPVMKFVAGSELVIEWTNQHECGRENTQCDIVIQYMCHSDLRDGTSTGTPSQNIYSRDKSKGKQEPAAYYAACKRRERNPNLYTADQNLRGKSARFTRQNPKGTRRGLECPEERDYYPYWGPSPWKDIVIMTDDQSKCKDVATESQNVKAKPYCAPKRLDRGGLAPLTEQACKDKGSAYEWITTNGFAAKHNLDAPPCLPVPPSRDNHLGNSEPAGAGSGGIPQTSGYTWTIPSNLAGANCAVRIRYNITVGDYASYGVSNAENAKKKDKPKINVAKDLGMSLAEADKRNYRMQNNPQIKPLSVGGKLENLKLQLAINTAQTGRTFQDRSHRMQFVERADTIPKTKKIHNLNVRGKRGNIVEVYPAVEYDFTPNKLRADRGDLVHVQWNGALTNNKCNDGQGQKKTDKSNIITVKDKVGGQPPKSGLGWPGNTLFEPINLPAKRFMGFNYETARRLAVPYKSDKPTEYYKTPPAGPNTGLPQGDEPETKDTSTESASTKDVPTRKMYMALEDELHDIQKLLNDTLITLLDANHHRVRRDTIQQQLAQLDTIASQIVTKKSTKDASTEDVKSNENSDADDKTDVDADNEDDEESEENDEGGPCGPDRNVNDEIEENDEDKDEDTSTEDAKSVENKDVDDKTDVDDNVKDDEIEENDENKDESDTIASQIVTNKSTKDASTEDVKSNENNDADDKTDVDANNKDDEEIEENDEDKDDKKDEGEAKDSLPASRRRRRRRRRQRRRRGAAQAARSTRRRRRSSRRRNNNNNNNGGKVQNELNQSPEYVDMGPQKADTCGKWHYMCTRNNNFSNRSQKGKLEIVAGRLGCQ